MPQSIEVGNTVRVAKGCDETYDDRYTGRCGTVVRVQGTGADVGESPEDPFITVEFHYGCKSNGFWTEELEKLWPTG